MTAKSKIHQFINRIVSIGVDKSKGIIKYDSDNLLPQKIIRQIGESGTATACIDKLNQYVFADGLVDQELGKQKVNDKQTFNQLISESVPYSTLFQAVAYHIQRFPNGKVAKMTSIPFEKIRATIEGNYIYNPTYGYDVKFDISKDVEYPKFRGPEISQIELKGHIQKYGVSVGEILYFFKKKPGQYVYPIPSFYSAISDIDADAENSKYELETTNNSFLSSGILNILGDFDDITKNERGLTEWDEYNEEISKFTGETKNASGETGRQKLLVLNAPTKELAPVYQPLSNDTIFTAIELSTKRVARKVARAFGVPDFLVGLGESVGFSTNIISDQITLFNNSIKITQEINMEPFRMCFPEFEFELTQNYPIKFIPTEVFAQLTPAEIRAIGGYTTEETKTDNSPSLAQKLGVGSTTSLVEIIKDPLLTSDQKLNTLIVLFNIPEENAKKLVGNVIPAVNN